MEGSLKLIVLILSLFELSEVKSTTHIYGASVNIEDYPYYAYLTDGFSKNLKCGGAIISKNLILTAAHCLDDRKFYVYVGISTLSDLQYSIPYSVSWVLKYPYYTDNVWDDIGLVKLKDNLMLEARVQIIGIATADPPLNVKGEIIGFGKLDCNDDFWDPSVFNCDDVVYEHLRSGLVEVTGDGHGVIYTTGRNLNTCAGDSGGPLVYNNTEVVVIGISTAGSHNGCDSYNTHASVSMKHSWIDYYKKYDN